MWNVVVTPLLTLYWVPYIYNFDLLGEFEHVLNKYKLISTLWWVPLFALAAYLISVDVLRRIEILITVMLELNAIRKRLEWNVSFKFQTKAGPIVAAIHETLWISKCWYNLTRQNQHGILYIGSSTSQLDCTP